MEQVVLPELGEGIRSATVACVHCRAGDEVAKDQDLVELVTDKATFSVSAPQDGTVTEVLVEKGQEPKIGDTLVLIEKRPDKDGDV